MVDTLVLGTSALRVRVRVPPSVQKGETKDSIRPQTILEL